LTPDTGERLPFLQLATSLFPRLNLEAAFNIKTNPYQRNLPNRCCNSNSYSQPKSRIALSNQHWSVYKKESSKNYHFKTLRNSGLY